MSKLLNLLGAALVLVGLSGCGGGGGSPALVKGQQELRDYPYAEVIPRTVSNGIVTEHFFNTVAYGPIIPQQFTQITEQQTIDAYNLAYGSDCVAATLNGPRYWVVDTITSLGGITSSPDELTVGGIKFGLAAQLESPVGTPRAGEIPYVLNPMQRNTTYTFLKGRLVYELTDPDGNVYVMQSYSQQYEPQLSLANLPDIGPRLHLPTGWSYATRNLPEDLFLTANGSTQVVLDDFRNAYQINPADKGRVP